MDNTKASQSNANEQWPNGWWVTRVAETGSTNTDLVKLGAEGAKHHSVLMADFQSAGKGRLDRTWVAEPGANLLVSLLFRTNETLVRPLHQFTQMVGMSAARACMQLTGVLPDMKWPNDLLISNKKVSGILAQGAPGFVVVGIGVNVNWAPPDAMSLAQAAPHHATSPVQLLHNMLIAIDELEALSPEQLHEQYSATLATLGQAVRVELATGDIVEGRAIEVQRDGRLVVLDDCAISHYIDTGDVVHLRAQKRLPFRAVSEIIFQPRAKKTWLHSLTTSALVALVVSLFGAVGVVRAVNADLDTVKREDTATTALSPADAEFENYLFVGSDSRVGADPGDADYGNVGDAGDIGGQRSDTLMVLHYVKRTGTVSLMSIPRDLWVAIGNGENEQRINTAYQEGTDVLVRTVQRALNIPIHHYVEIDFQGFKRIVEAVGGVNVCVEYPSRDKHTGLFMKAGCTTLDGVEGLAYARSRYFEQKVDGEWQLDGTSDIGRSTRQRGFVQALAKSAVIGVSGNPFKAGSVLKGGLSAVIVDNNLDLIEFAKKMRPAAGGNIASLPLDVYGDTVGSNSVLRLGKGSGELIAFFNGTGPRPQLNP